MSLMTFTVLILMFINKSENGKFSLKKNTLCSVNSQNFEKC